MDAVAKVRRLASLSDNLDRSSEVLERIGIYLGGCAIGDGICIPADAFCIEEGQLKFPFLGNQVVVKPEVGKNTSVVLVWRIYDTTTEEYKAWKAVHPIEDITGIPENNPVKPPADVTRLYCLATLFDLIDRNSEELAG